MPNKDAPWEDAPQLDSEPWASAPTVSAPTSNAGPPKVGAGETFVNSFNDVIPMGRSAVNAVSSGILNAVENPSRMKAALADAFLPGAGSALFSPGAELTDKAKEELRSRGMKVPERPSFLDTFRRVRDDRAERVAAGSEQHSTTSGLGTTAGLGALLLAPMPKVNVGTGAAGRLLSTTLTGAGYGAANKLDHAQANLADGDVSDYLREVSGIQGLSDARQSFAKGNYGRGLLDFLGAGAIGGGGGGLAAGLIGEGAGKIAGRAERGQAAALADQAAKDARLAEKTQQSTLGEYRSAIQSASRVLENAERAAAGGDTALAREAQTFLQTPEAAKLRETVLRGSMEQAPERIADVARLKEELSGASMANSPEYIDATARQALQNPLQTQVLPRLKTYATRAIGPAIGGAVGGVPGAAMGTLVSNTMGRPGTAMANMMKSPATRNMLWGGLRWLTQTAPESANLVALPSAVPTLARNESAFLQAAALAKALREKNKPEDTQTVAGDFGL